MLVVNDETEIAAIGCCRFEGGDLMIVVLREPGEPWAMVYRFRYDDPTGGDDDVRNWHSVSANAEAREWGTAEEAKAKLVKAAQIPLRLTEQRALMEQVDPKLLWHTETIHGAEEFFEFIAGHPDWWRMRTQTGGPVAEA